MSTDAVLDRLSREGERDIRTAPERMVGLAARWAELAASSGAAYGPAAAPGEREQPRGIDPDMAFDRPDLDALIDILAAAARAEVMPRFGRLGPDEVWTKSGPLDFATVADVAAERAIGAALRAAFPSALIVGEESAEPGKDPGEMLAGASLAFVIDPIDGTFNYRAGVPLFATMTAVVAGGEVIAGAIHDPVSATTAWGLAGEGAWLTGPGAAGTRLRVADPAPLSHLTGIASWQYLPAPFQERVIGGLARTATVWNYRCAGHEYRMAAAGLCHFLLYNRLLPWDHAPGWLIHREAGGHAARFDGSPYSVRSTEGGLICAPDRATWDLIRAGVLG